MNSTLMIVRRLNFLALLALGSTWAGALTIIGALLLTRDLINWPGLDSLGRTIGVTFIAAGQFVFLVVVADRMFPRANPRVTMTCEAGLGLALLLGVGVCSVLLIAGAGGT